VTGWRGARLTLALAIVLLLGACTSDSSIVDTHGSEANRVAGVWWLIFGLAAGVYVIVAGFILFAAARGRRKHPRPASRLRDNLFIWIGGVIAPLVILMVLAAVTVNATAHLRNASRNELVVEVTGKRWWWDVRYPKQAVATANEIHIPAGQPVDFVLTSDNVIHSFWVPELAGKEDTIPGQVNHLRFTADKVGTYRGFCAEFCGLEHAHMGFLVIVQSPADFGRWLAQREQPPPPPDSDLAERGAVTFQRLPCAGCHTVRGTQANGTVGPDLTDVGSRRTLGSVTIDNTSENLTRWITDAQSIKPGSLMPPISMSSGDAQAVVAYLQSLK
jgi:cytochrome c oxidase subunit 2